MQGTIYKKLDEKELVMRKAHLLYLRPTACRSRTDALGMYMEMAHTY